MKGKMLFFGISIFLLTGLVAAGNHTGFNISSESVDVNVSVNQFGENVANISSKYYDNSSSSRNFDVNVSGNVSQIVDSPGSYTLFDNESSSFPVVANVPSDQQFGSYTGNLTMTGSSNSSFSDSVNLSVSVFDDIPPEFTDLNIDSVEATNTVDWMVRVEDNLNVSSVSGQVLRQEFVNGSASGNETVESFDFQRGSGSDWNHSFDQTDVIGQYFVEITAKDESNNSVSRTDGFEVTGLDSISVLSENFVFDTVQVKDEASFDFVRNRQEGKKFSIGLRNLSYGGNESVRLGVLPPNGESPEFLSVGDSRSYSDSGVYDLVLVHSGNDEVEGTHRVTGEIRVEKPGHHVSPVNVTSVFSGTVKNLDKPSSTCERVGEFDSCVAYSLDSAQSLFNEEYNISDSGDRSFAYLIGRVPTSDVEGSSEWGDELSLTFGEYNETLSENKRLSGRIEELESSNGFKAALLLWVPVLLTGFFGVLFVYYLRVGRYISYAQSRHKIIEKASVKNPEEGLN